MMAPTARFGGAGGHFYSLKHLAPLLGAINGATSTIQCGAERHSLCPWSADTSTTTWPHWELPKGMGRGPAGHLGEHPVRLCASSRSRDLRGDVALESSISRTNHREVDQPACTLRGVDYNGAFHVC